MQRNYVCDLVMCHSWNSIANGNEDITIEELSKECQLCKHCRLSILKSECNFVDIDRI